jgi:N-acetylneuraminic acid mutarotase
VLLLFLLSITWEYRTSAPGARTYPAIGDMTAMNSSGHACVYAIGGATLLNQVRTNYEYDCVTNIWTPRTQMPIPARYDFAGCRAYRAGVERLYVIGGYQSVYIYLTDVDEYTPSTNSWASQADMPTQREGVRAAVIGNMIYAIGGDYFDLNQYIDYVYDIVERYEPETDQWTTGYAAMPTARTDACCAVAVNEYGDSCIYVFGGSTSIVGYVASNAVEEYYPTTDSWRVRNSSGFTARGGAMAVTDRNNLIYVIGGTTDGSGSVGLVQVYDPINDIWSSDNPIQTARDGVTGGVAGDIGGRIHVVAGSTGATPVSTNERSAEIVNVDEAWVKRKKTRLHIKNNPFRLSTEIIFFIQNPGFVQLNLFDVQGNHTVTIADGMMQAGEHSAYIDGAGLSSGVYFLRLETEEYQETRKVLLLK